MAAFEGRWNHTHEPKGLYQDPNYRDLDHPSQGPPITAFGNDQYIGMIKRLKYIWNDAHPEVQFQAFKAKEEYQGDNGYIIYSLIDRVPKDNMRKPIPRYKYLDPEEDTWVTVFIQSFMNTVKFTAMHQDPDVAEEIIDNFENFMLECIPVLKSFGIEDILYNRRLSDEHEQRTGEDLAARSVTYVVITQKVLPVSQKKLEEIHLRLETLSATPSTLIPSAPADPDGTDDSATPHGKSYMPPLT